MAGFISFSKLAVGDLFRYGRIKHIRDFVVASLSGVGDYIVQKKKWLSNRRGDHELYIKDCGKS